MRKIRRMNPMSYWLVGEHESWFSHMASKGYHLVKINQLVSTFEKREPQEVSYRIELVNGTALSLEQIDLYEQSGWDYVESSKMYHVFASPKERKATEIYTDPTEQAITVEYLKKASKKNLGIFAITTVILLIFFGGGFLTNDPFLYWLVNGGILFNFFLAFIYGMNTVVMFKGYKGLKKLALQLDQGQQIDHEAEWRGKFTKEWIFGTILLAFFVLMISMPWYSIVKMQSVTLPDDTSSEPILRIEALLDGQYIQNEFQYFDDNTDWNQYWEKEWNLLAPIMYKTRQDGFEAVNGESTQNPEQLYTDYYEMRFEALAKPMLNSVMEYEEFIHSEGAYTEIKHNVFDELYVYDDEFGFGFEFYARLGKQVLKIEYSGKLSDEEVIERAAAFYSKF